MKKQLLLVLISGFALAACEKPLRIEYKESGYEMQQIDSEKVTVVFYKNIAKEEIDLNSGMYASTSSTALKVDVIEKNSKVTRPETDPLRINYEFAGWHTDQNENSPFDFESAVQKNLFLYAHWNKLQEEEFIEPEYVEPSHIDDSIDDLVSISGVLNINLVGTNVKLTSAGIARLKRNPIDVKDCLNYKIKSEVTLTATYSEVGSKTISYTATKEGEPDQVGTISISDITAAIQVDDENYEKKAKNYESRDVDIEDHRIMLAGSSSIENWKNSATDLQPMTTYNHGIGGTTVEMWRDSLNQRLVYPYSPKIVVYYVGVNNMKDGVNTGQETGEMLVEMFNDVHAHLPNTHIYYILVNELPGFRNRQAQFDVANSICLNYEAEHSSYFTAINAGTGLLKSNGEPNQAYFLFDGIHMSLAGYAIWGKVIKDKKGNSFSKKVKSKHSSPSASKCLMPALPNSWVKSELASRKRWSCLFKVGSSFSTETLWFSL